MIRCSLHYAVISFPPPSRSRADGTAWGGLGGEIMQLGVFVSITIHER